MTIKITTELLDDLIDKATAATPGPWQQCNGSDVFTEHGGKSAEGIEAIENDGWQIADCGVGKTFTVNDDLESLDVLEQYRNAKYIAAVNPDVVRALVNEIKVLRKTIDRSQRELV